MKITIMGTGYVGLVCGVALADAGFPVTCMDTDGEKIAQLQRGSCPIYEPGLDALLVKNMQAGRLTFTTSKQEAVRGGEVIFIAVGTPKKEDGSADLQHVLEAARTIAQHIEHDTIIVTKSTVPVGTAGRLKQEIASILANRGVNHNFEVVANPEFLREGSAINDLLHPERIVIGAESETARKIMGKLYSGLYPQSYPVLYTNLETAEMIKYASNAFLATKITYINEIANLCEAVGANALEVARAMGLDERIGKHFLQPGPGYGGSCLPKDTKALASLGQAFATPQSIVESVIKANHNQRLRMVEKIIQALGNPQSKTIAILGLAFKPQTDDLREAPALSIIRELLKAAAQIRAYDPIAMKRARGLLCDVNLHWARDEYEAAQGAAALVLVTDWNQFRELDLGRIKGEMQGNLFFDLRNLYPRETIEALGFVYQGVGR